MKMMMQTVRADRRSIAMLLRSLLHPEAVRDLVRLIEQTDRSDPLLYLPLAEPDTRPAPLRLLYLLPRAAPL